MQCCLTGLSSEDGHHVDCYSRWTNFPGSYPITEYTEEGRERESHWDHIQGAEQTLQSKRPLLGHFADHLEGSWPMIKNCQYLISNFLNSPHGIWKLDGIHSLGLRRYRSHWNHILSKLYATHVPYAFPTCSDLVLTLIILHHIRVCSNKPESFKIQLKLILF